MYCSQKKGCFFVCYCIHTVFPKKMDKFYKVNLSHSVAGHQKKRKKKMWNGTTLPASCALCRKTEIGNEAPLYNCVEFVYLLFILLFFFFFFVFFVLYGPLTTEVGAKKGNSDR